MNFCTVCQGSGIVGGMAPCNHCAGQFSSFIPHPDPTIPNSFHQPYTQQLGSTIMPTFPHNSPPKPHMHPWGPTFIQQPPILFPKPDPTFPNPFPYDHQFRPCMSPMGIPWDLRSHITSIQMLFTLIMMDLKWFN